MSAKKAGKQRPPAARTVTDSGRVGERIGTDRAPEDPRADARLELGQQTRRAILGDDHVDRAQAATTPFTAPFQEYLTGAAWADVWSRPGLDRRTRSAVTLAILAALRAEGELGMHVRAALRNGLTADEIAEVLLQCAVYAGMAAANAAFAIAQRELTGRDPAPAHRAPRRDQLRDRASHERPPRSPSVDSSTRWPADDGRTSTMQAGRKRAGRKGASP